MVNEGWEKGDAIGQSHVRLSGINRKKKVMVKEMVMPLLSESESKTSKIHSIKLLQYSTQYNTVQYSSRAWKEGSNLDASPPDHARVLL